MSHGVVTEAFGDGHYTFRLAIGQWLELEEKCDLGAPVIVAMFMQRTWRVSHLREVIRLGLIGGGSTPVDALKLVERYVDQRPVFEFERLAQTIVFKGAVPPKAVREKRPSAESPEAVEGEPTSPPLSETVQ